MTHLPPVLADSSNALGRSRRASKRTTSGSIMSSMIATFVDTVKKSLPSKDLARYQSVPAGDNAEHESSSGNSPVSNVELQHKFSFFEYAVFVLLGVAMYVTIFIWAKFPSASGRAGQGGSLHLWFSGANISIVRLWSWNMFMACATYFQGRFAENEFILHNFQSMILGVSTVTNLGVMVYLSKHQSSANYPYRICTSLILNCMMFTLFAMSTITFHVGSTTYLVFTLMSVIVASLSCGFSQNGVFAFVNSFGGIYTQAIMTGQGIAGVLPAIAQIVSVLAFAQSTGEQSGPSSPKSAFAYFLAATFVSGLSFILFLFLLSRYGLTINSKTNSHFLSCSDSEQDIETRRVVSLFVLWRKLMYPSFAIWLSFCLTMVFPVFTQAITSVKSDGAGRAFQPDVFIPTAFLLWNIGDLSGRIACGWKSVTITSPRMLVFISMSRAAFIPLYVMCNVGGHGAIIENDGFYWLVQLVFGFTNGWVGTSCMIVAPNYVENDEKEVCGGFMGLCLVLGLATGSVMSFFVVIK